MKMLKKFGLGLLALLALTAIGLAIWEPISVIAQKAPPKRDYSVEIIRDTYGVPHIYGKTDADAAYGLAYAHAEDDFSTIQEVIAMTRGRAGAMLGADGAKVDYALALLGARETAARDYAKIPADVRAVAEGYAAGLNRFAENHPGEVRLSKLFPVNGEDIVTGFVLRAPFFFGLDNVIGKLVDGKDPPRESALAMVPGPEDALPVASNDPQESRLTAAGLDPGQNGSNGWAISPRKMADGKTWLVSNSHQPYEGGVAWYEAVTHSDEGLDMAGALFPGAPMVLLGHNRNLGWTNTVNQPDLVDTYKLSTNAAGDQYQFDGKWLPLRQKRVWLKVRFGPFVLPVPQKIYRSIHGPVIVNKSGAFAIRYAGQDNVKLLEQYFRNTKARDWAEWTKSMSLGGIPATNFIYADKTGRIANIYYALFPDRNPGFDYNGVLPGNTSKALWDGPVGFDKMPKLVNPKSGWLANANNTPFMAAGPGSEMNPADWSPLLGIEGRQTNRIHRAIELLSAEKGKITPERLLAIKFDKGYSKASFAGPWLGKVLSLDLKDAPELKAAQDLLRQWDWTSDGVGKADALAETLLHKAHGAAYAGRPMPDARTALAETIAELTSAFGRIDSSLGDIQRLEQGDISVPIAGGTDTLRAATIWRPGKGAASKIVHGDSFIMLTSWDKAGKVWSQSIQPFGAATTRVRSKHYTDQTALFAAQKFKPVHFEWADAVAQGNKPYRPE